MIKYKYFNSSDEFEKWQLGFQGINKLVIHNIVPCYAGVTGWHFLFSKMQYKEKIFVTYNEVKHETNTN